MYHQVHCLLSWKQKKVFIYLTWNSTKDYCYSYQSSNFSIYFYSYPDIFLETTTLLILVGFVILYHIISNHFYIFMWICLVILKHLKYSSKKHYQFNFYLLKFSNFNWNFWLYRMLQVHHLDLKILPCHHF